MSKLILVGLVALPLTFSVAFAGKYDRHSFENEFQRQYQDQQDHMQERQDRRDQMYDDIQNRQHRAFDRDYDNNRHDRLCDLGGECDSD